MLGRRASKPGGGAAEQSTIAFDRVGTTTMPSHHLFAPPKLFLATSAAAADEVAASEAVMMSPTSILQASSGHTSPATCHVHSSGEAVNPCSRGGSSGGDRRSQCQRRRSWEARPVGLGLAGALNGEATGAATTTTVLTGLRLRPAHTTSAPCSSPSPVAAASEAFGVKSCPNPALAYRRMSPREMEASEDYTRVIARGPNARRTTHIFEVRVVVDGCGLSAGSGDDEFLFLRWCHGCSKELGQGKDIFMYRGEMAFCSNECRYREMLLEEKL